MKKTSLWLLAKRECQSFTENKYICRTTSPLIIFLFFEAFEQVLMPSQNWNTGRKRPADLALWEHQVTAAVKKG